MHATIAPFRYEKCNTWNTRRNNIRSGWIMVWEINRQKCRKNRIHENQANMREEYMNIWTKIRPVEKAAYCLWWNILSVDKSLPKTNNCLTELFIQAAPWSAILIPSFHILPENRINQEHWETDHSREWQPAPSLC